MYKFFSILIFLSLIFSRNLHSKVYDCFTFFNEMELLEIRLNELYDEVDHFVIVENPLTFSGNEKELYFEKNKERFKKFEDKIIHVVGPKRPEEGVWAREEAQRNDILLGLKDAKEDDIIIVSDLDEIVKKEKIKEIKKIIAEKKDPVELRMVLYRYFLNRKDRKVSDWRLAYATTYKILKKYMFPFLDKYGFKYNHRESGQYIFYYEKGDNAIISFQLFDKYIIMQISGGIYKPEGTPIYLSILINGIHFLLF